MMIVGTPVSSFLHDCHVPMSIGEYHQSTYINQFSNYSVIGSLLYHMLDSLLFTWETQSSQMNIIHTE